MILNNYAHGGLIKKSRCAPAGGKPRRRKPPSISTGQIAGTLSFRLSPRRQEGEASWPIWDFGLSSMERRWDGANGVRANKSATTLLPHRRQPSRRRLGVDGNVCCSVLQIGNLVFLAVFQIWRDQFLGVSLAIVDIRDGAGYRGDRKSVV